MNLKYRISSLIIPLIAATPLTLLPAPQNIMGRSTPQRSADGDRQTLIELEREWLMANDASTLNRILASDFVHPVFTGDFLTKTEHIDWVTRHPRPANIKPRFERLDVRLYGDMAIANGIVVTSDESGKEIGRNVFTDVFAYRNGRWEAINGQETDVRKTK
jgi:hypothetical protein